MYYFKRDTEQFENLYIELEQFIHKSSLSPVFYIDLNSINTAAFNEKVIIQEINTKGHDLYLVNDYKDFLIELYERFEKYSPLIITFFDTGGSVQNKIIDENYKAHRKSIIKKMIDEEKITEDEGKLYKKIKSRYNDILIIRFQNDKHTTINLENYESDLIPHFVISENILGDKINFIFSNDKDLVQTCGFPNTYQITQTYSKYEQKTIVKIWNYRNSLYKMGKDTTINNILKKLNINLQTNQYFTPEYIPLILALIGDVADNIPALFKRKVHEGKCPAMGIAKALKMIFEQNIPYDLNLGQISLGDDLKGYEKDLFINYQLTSFDEQIKRIPDEIKKQTINRIKNNFNLK